MSAPSTPTNFFAQQGNGQVYLSCDLMSGATTYPILRSTDGVTFSQIAAPSTPGYLDTTVTAGTTYYYQMQAANGSGTSAATAAQSVVPVTTGQMTLGQMRVLAQQEADMVNSQFISVPEWNTYLNQSASELYDLLIDAYEEYYVKAPYTITTDGVSNQFTLPSDFYKLLGVDFGLSTSGNAWVTLRKFDFIARNRYVYPQMGTTLLGINNPEYRLVGSTLMFIPTPQAAQFIRVWYIPRLPILLQDTDTLDGISGWTEYVIVDAAIKALEKEESDTSALMLRKAALLKRIEDSAVNRDAGQPDTISNTRSRSELWGGYGPPNGDGGYGGF